MSRIPDINFNNLVAWSRAEQVAETRRIAEKVAYMRTRPPALPDEAPFAGLINSIKAFFRDHRAAYLRAIS